MTYKSFFWSYFKHNEYPNVENKRDKRVFQYDKNKGLISIYDSVSYAAKATGLSKTSISRVCRDERKQAGGFIWKYCWL
ncbi:NUMOD1 domain-containing DNA-binding protein [Allomuricauda sp. R78024]|uniref:NUMOD1 domain-containing DNA-binding protein n=1 Tax=Allomuricauda sp. R78024 TaxID=3093867 RepID=UPI0037CAF713